ncbi:sensor histidine kinase [Flavobacterium microcysteis]
MNNKFLTLLFVMGAYGTYGQVGIGTGIPDDSTQLEVVANNKGILTSQLPHTSSKETAITNSNTNSQQVFNSVTTPDVTQDYYIQYNELQENNRNLEQSQKTSRQVIMILILFSVTSGILLLLLFRAYKKVRNDYKKKAALYEIIENKNISLSKADAVKSNLVSILAHDFRSPLISTLYMMRLLERNTELLTQSEKESFYIAISNDISVTLENFDATLQWIKRQLGEFKINLETVNIRSLLDEAISGYNVQLNEKGITVINNIPDGILATSDREMLQFVNRNLLSNALKFSPKGKTIAIDALKTGNEIIISVKDEGPGLSDNQMKKLFSISNKAGSTHQGAGIALSFSKDFIVKLGGRIWAENRNTGGTIFSYGVPSRSISKIVA